MEICNSLWCLDLAGKLCQVDEVSGDAALVRYVSKDGKHGELVRVPLTELKQARASDLPNGLMSRSELEDYGYASAPPPAVPPRAAPAADPEK